MQKSLSKQETNHSQTWLMVLDYMIWATLSAIGGIYLILPVFYHDALGISELKASSAVTGYFVGAAVGMFSYMRFFALLKKKVQTIIPYNIERLFLGSTGILVSIAFIKLNHITSYHQLIILMFMIGLLSSAFMPLKQSILNVAAYTRGSIKHASCQGWTQNIGMGIMFLLFSLYKNWPELSVFYILGSILFMTSCIELFLAIKNDAHKTISSNDDSNTTFTPTSKSNLIIFFGLFTLVMIIFMQIPNLYAFYLTHNLHLDADVFAKFMIFNVILVIFFQIPISNLLTRLNINIKHMFSFGILLVGFGIITPILGSLLSVFISFIAWTFGEIILFIGIRAYLIEISKGNSSESSKNTIRFYSIFYLSNISCPLIIHFLYERYDVSILLAYLFIASALTCVLGLKLLGKVSPR